MSKLVSFLAGFFLVILALVTIFSTSALINKIDKHYRNKVSDRQCGHLSLSKNCDYRADAASAIFGIEEIMFGFFYLILGNIFLFAHYKEESKKSKIINGVIFSVCYSVLLLISIYIVRITGAGSAH